MGGGGRQSPFAAVVEEEEDEDEQGPWQVAFHDGAGQSVGAVFGRSVSARLAAKQVLEDLEEEEHEEEVGGVVEAMHPSWAMAASVEARR
jgi:hypothetical protein